MSGTARQAAGPPGGPRRRRLCRGDRAVAARAWVLRRAVRPACAGAWPARTGGGATPPKRAITSFRTLVFPTPLPPL